VGDKIERLREKIKVECRRVNLTKINDPRAGFLTIQNVELSKDLRHARYSCDLGATPSAEGYAHAQGRDRASSSAAVAGTSRTRVQPALAFIHDSRSQALPRRPRSSSRSRRRSRSGPAAAEAASDEDGEGPCDDEEEEEKTTRRSSSVLLITRSAARARDDRPPTGPAGSTVDERREMTETADASPDALVAGDQIAHGARVVESRPG